jgi:hypothetical protein
VVFDDVFTMITVGDSYVGRLLDQLGGIGTKGVVVNNIKEAFAAFKQVASDLNTVTVDVGHAFGLAFNDALPLTIAAVVTTVKVAGRRG